MIDLDERGPDRLEPALVQWMQEQLHPLWWHKAAACRGADQALFFIDRGQSAAAAKRMCARCPVQAACLEFALEAKPTHGIWAGMTYRELRQYGRAPEEAPKVSPKSKIEMERERKTRLAATLFEDGHSLDEIARKLKMDPYRALGYLSEEQRTALLAQV